MKFQEHSEIMELERPSYDAYNGDLSREYFDQPDPDLAEAQLIDRFENVNLVEGNQEVAE